ncbi:hypothetical protein GCM10027033_24510 [Leucobacter ruminantium]
MRRVTGPLTATWRCLCLLAGITASAALTGLLWYLPLLLQAVGILCLWIVALCVVVAGWHDSGPSGSR